MMRTVTMTHQVTGQKVVLETAMDLRFLERMYPEWQATEGGAA